MKTLSTILAATVALALVTGTAHATPTTPGNDDYVAFTEAWSPSVEYALSTANPGQMIYQPWNQIRPETASLTATVQLTLPTEPLPIGDISKADLTEIRESLSARPVDDPSAAQQSIEDNLARITIKTSKGTTGPDVYGIRVGEYLIVPRYPFYNPFLKDTYQTFPAAIATLDGNQYPVQAVSETSWWGNRAIPFGESGSLSIAHLLASPPLPGATPPINATPNEDYLPFVRDLNGNDNDIQLKPGSSYILLVPTPDGVKEQLVPMVANHLEDCFGNLGDRGLFCIQNLPGMLTIGKVPLGTPVLDANTRSFIGLVAAQFPLHRSIGPDGKEVLSRSEIWSDPKTTTWMGRNPDDPQLYGVGLFSDLSYYLPR